jgi:hypothetical protein
VIPAGREVASIAPPAAEIGHLPRGDLARIAVPGIACDEVRLKVLCRYAPGLASLAKSYVRLQAWGRRGLVSTGVFPVPPAHLAIELRFPVPRTPLVRVELEVGSPGTFNPSPVSVAVPTVRLVVYTGPR